MALAPPLERLLQRDRVVVQAGLVGISALAWGWMVREAHQPPPTPVPGSVYDPVCGCFGLNLAGPDFRPWRPTDWLLLFLMWTEMMVAMMVPTAAPMLLTFGQINRRRAEQQRPFVATSVFLAGYLVVWTAFSAAAAAAQWAMHSVSLLSPGMVTTNTRLAGSLLLAAGIFQFLPWKRACLAHCRSPLELFATHWREGTGGAFAMGLHHGAFCTGCCWLLMLLLFVVGVMNLFWIAALTVLVLLEKVAPGGRWIGRLAGLALLAWGGWLLGGGITGRGF